MEVKNYKKALGSLRSPFFRLILDLLFREKFRIQDLVMALRAFCRIEKLHGHYPLTLLFFTEKVTFPLTFKKIDPLATTLSTDFKKIEPLATTLSTD